MTTVKFLMMLPPTNYYLRILKMNHIINDFLLNVHTDHTFHLDDLNIFNVKDILFSNSDISYQFTCRLELPMTLKY